MKPSPNLDCFLLYYTAWHEGEFSLSSLKTQVVDEIGIEGLMAALAELRADRLHRGYSTYYKYYSKVW
jgi:hypothetical protein